MFDMGWSELLVVGVVALIVVGPKDLPVLFRKVGQFVGKAKGMAREFSTAMNDAADDTGMREISSGLNKSLTDINPDSETGKLAAKRAEDSKKVQAVRDRTIAERKQREAKEALAAADAEVSKLAKPAAPAAKAAPAKKAAAKPAAAKKAPAKKAAAPKTAAAKKPAAKPAAKKPAAKKPAAKNE
jgi:sec-independent protein translocase protein TatB